MTTMTAGEYLQAVARMHGLTFRAMARALKVDPAVLRRWRRDRVAPSWRRVQKMTSLWGGNPHVIFLGTVLEWYRQQTGLTRQETRRLCTGRVSGMARKRPRAPAVDKDQLSLPMGPARAAR
jgi:transcriptional regulator with XRE-family HTH domain